MRTAVGRLGGWFAHTRLGRQAVAKLVMEDPETGAAILGWQGASSSSFARPRWWPDELRGFEDVTFVLSSSVANRGLASMTLDEAAHLWRCARDAGPGVLVEIGRERGGSTFLIAAAMAPDATLVSYDPHTKDSAGSRHDENVGDALERYGLRGRVDLLVEDSHTASPPAEELALVLVDGDPSLKGTRTDVDRYGRRLRRGGLALLHDAAPGGSRHATLAPLLVELDADRDFERLPDVGSFVTYRRA